MVFSATVPLQPSIELNDYQSIRVPREKTKVGDDEVEKSMTDLRRRYCTLEPVDRAAQKGDIVTGSIKATAEDDVNLVNQEVDVELHLYKPGTELSPVRPDSKLPVLDPDGRPPRDHVLTQKLKFAPGDPPHGSTEFLIDPKKLAAVRCYATQFPEEKQGLFARLESWAHH